MPDEGGLTGISYKISDKAWAFAEWLESKGIPLASFCDKHHINPFLLLAVIALIIIVLVVFAMGVLGGISYGTLSVTVVSNGQPVEGATVSYLSGTDTISNTTNALGKAQLKFPIGPETEVTASKSGYNSGNAKVTLKDATGSTQISLVRKVGTLAVAVNVAGGKQLPSGSYVVITSAGQVSDTKPPVNGVATFENLPAGATVTVYLSVGNQHIPPNGQQVTIQEGKTTTTTINVPENSLSTSLAVNVVDSLGQSVDGASVQLFNCEIGMPIGDPQTTYSGSATFNDVVLGTKIYVTVDPADASYGSYNGRDNCLDVTGSGLTYQVSLPVAGKVEVCVYDQNGAPLNTGTIILKGADGTTYATRAIAQECEDFTGMSQGVSVYPVVNAQGYQSHSVPSEAKTVDYSTITSFTVNMQPLAEGSEVGVYVQVSDCDGNPVRGMKVKVIDVALNDVLDEATTECGGSATVTIPTCGNARIAIASGTSIYAVAFDDEYQLSKSGVEIAEEGKVLDIISCKADEENSGNLEACVYKNGNPFNKAEVELFDTDNNLLWTARTDQDEDDTDNCYTFKNIPDGKEVYAKAINLGSTPAVSGTATIAAGTTGNVTLYSGTAPIILKKGSVKVCTRDAAANTSLTADVSIYDQAIDKIIVSGKTATGGCWVFLDIAAEANIGGQIVPREIYIVVNKTGYATYNGKEDEAILTMVPNGVLTVNVYLPEAFPICVQVRASDTSRTLDGDVTLYYDKDAEIPIEQKSTADGTVRFSQAMKDNYYFRVNESYTLYEPKDIYTFKRADVSQGNCGIITLYDLGTLCDLGMEVLDSGTKIRVVAGLEAQVPIRILKGGDRGDSSITKEGTISNKQKVQLTDGKEANVTLKLNGAFKQFSLTYGSTSFSSDQEIIAGFTVSDPTSYSGLFEVAENSLCVRQVAFNLEVYKEQLQVSTDSVTFDPVTQSSVSFCIYVKDQDGTVVTDASVQVQVDDMDGWAQTTTKNANYDETKRCYRGALAAAMAPKETSGRYKSGTFKFSVIAKRGDITKIAEGEATISATNLCGNGKIDSNEKCDASATTTGCATDYVCNAYCTACEATECGALSVTANTVSLSIGSGRSSGFCVKVTDDCGEVKNAQVTARFDGSGGWYQDSAVTAGYDIVKGCYYVPVAENLAWPTGQRSTSGMLGSKTIGIAAVKGSRTGSTTTTARITCGCDDESYCEPNCPCDEDCETGGAGSFNLFGCLQLMGQQGYYPSSPYGVPYNSYNPYSNYGVPGAFGGSQVGYYGSTPYYGASGAYPGYGGTPYYGASGAYPGYGGTMGGTGSIGMGGSGGGYIGLNFEACKQLLQSLGLMDSKVGGYVLVNDYAGLVSTSSDCDAIKKAVSSISKNLKYVYVHKAGTITGTDTCCTATKCDFDKFQKMLESAAQTGDFTILDIKQLDSSNSADVLGGDVKVLSGEGGRSALFASSRGGLYGTGAVVFLKSRISSTTTKANNQYVLGMLRDAPSGYRTLLSDAVISDIGNIIKSEGVRYPTSLSNDPAYTNVILAGDANNVPSDLKGVILTSNSDPEASYFSKLSPGTTLYVLSYYGDDSPIGQVAKSLDSGKKPKFEAVSPEFSYCPGSGALGKLPWSTPVLLKISDSAYLVNTGDKDARNDVVNGICLRLMSNLTKIRFDSTWTLTQAQKLGYAKKSSDKYLVMAYAEEDLNEIVKKFNNAKPAVGFSKVYLPGDDKWGIIAAQCSAGKLACTVAVGTRDRESKVDALAASNSITGLKTLPDSTAAIDHLLDCVCGGKADNPAAILVGKAIRPSNITSSLVATDVTAHIKPNGKAQIDYNLGNTGDTLSVESNQDGSITFKIKDTVKEWGSSQVWATWEPSTSLSTRACYMSNVVTVDISKLNSGVENSLQNDLQLTTDQLCIKNADAKVQFVITGTLKESRGNALPIIPVIASPGPTGSPIATATTDDNGRFSLGPFPYLDGNAVYLKADLGQNSPAPLPVQMSTSNAQKSASGNPFEASSAGGTYTIQQDITADKAVLICLEGTLKQCNGAKVTASDLVSIKGAAVSSVMRRGPTTIPGSRRGGTINAQALPPDDNGVFGIYSYLAGVSDSIGLQYGSQDIYTDKNTCNSKFSIAISSFNQCSGGCCYTYINDVYTKAAGTGGGPAAGTSAVTCTLKSFTVTHTGNNNYNLDAVVNCIKGNTAYASASDVSSFKFVVGNTPIPVTKPNPNNGDFALTTTTPIVVASQVYVKVDIDGDDRDDLLTSTSGVSNPITVTPGQSAGGATGGTGDSSGSVAGWVIINPVWTINHFNNQRNYKIAFQIADLVTTDYGASNVKLHGTSQIQIDGIWKDPLALDCAGWGLDDKSLDISTPQGTFECDLDNTLYGNINNDPASGDDFKVSYTLDRSTKKITITVIAK